MRSRSNYYRKKNQNRKLILYGLFAGIFLFLIIKFMSCFFYSDIKGSSAPNSLEKNSSTSSNSSSSNSLPSAKSNISTSASQTIQDKFLTDSTGTKDISWDGPVLYHKDQSGPINLILVEKAAQKLHLYRYDGKYELIKTYTCATGRSQGQKQEENDKKTPEGIYFNTKFYRDTKVTVFGDKAFQLNYPDSFDEFEGNGGRGIFIHGSNQNITPYSTKGCVALDNKDLEDLDKRIQFNKTPIIIGENLPYKFNETSKNSMELIPLLKKAMVPEQYLHKVSEFELLTLIVFKDRVVAFGQVHIKEKKLDIEGFSRLYIARPANNLLVMIKREWDEKGGSIILSSATQQAEVPLPGEPSQPKVMPDTPIKPEITVLPPEPSAPSESDSTGEITSLVESWRNAWEGKRLNDYISFYHPKFVGSGKSLNSWKQYKKSLYERYNKISLKISNIKVKINGQSAHVVFSQKYICDTFDEKGYKQLELKKVNNSWKIFREEFSQLRPKI